jgi:Na+-driven multidrug efflux pump
VKNERKSLVQLFVPISLELLCFMLAGMVDTMMLSGVSNDAVGAVGTANTYISMFIVMFSVITSGMIAVMTQYIGAGREGVAYQARQIGLAFNILIAMVISAILFFGAEVILDTVGIAPKLREYGVIYLKIVGGTSVLNATVPIFSGTTIFIFFIFISPFKYCCKYTV